jgi:hypothetical protein
MFPTWTTLESKEFIPQSDGWKENDGGGIHFYNDWLASVFQHGVLGKSLPAVAVLSGDAAIVLKWRDLSKIHGTLEMEGTLRAANNVLPGAIATWFGLSSLSQLNRQPKL